MGKIFFGVVAAVIAWAVIAYNRLIAKRNGVDNAWKQIDVQLKRRHDLIPNLIETVKGAMEYERDTLEAVVNARARAVAARGVGESVAAEQALGQSLGRLLAVMENYPTLKANENVLRLQEELTTTENQIGFARQFYNDSVTAYNIAMQVFPTNLIAGFFAFQPAELFGIGDDERAVPRVDLRIQPR